MWVRAVIVVMVAVVRWRVRKYKNWKMCVRFSLSKLTTSPTEKKKKKKKILKNNNFNNFNFFYKLKKLENGGEILFVETNNSTHTKKKKIIKFKPSSFSSSSFCFSLYQLYPACFIPYIGFVKLPYYRL